MIRRFKSMFRKRKTPEQEQDEDDEAEKSNIRMDMFARALMKDMAAARLEMRDDDDPSSENEFEEEESRSRASSFFGGSRRDDSVQGSDSDEADRPHYEVRTGVIHGGAATNGWHKGNLMSSDTSHGSGNNSSGDEHRGSSGAGRARKPSTDSSDGYSGRVRKNSSVSFDATSSTEISEGGDNTARAYTDRDKVDNDDSQRNPNDYRAVNGGVDKPRRASRIRTGMSIDTAMREMKSQLNSVDFKEKVNGSHESPRQPDNGSSAEGGDSAEAATADAAVFDPSRRCIVSL